MSKLFETLETIRRRESPGSPRMAPVQALTTTGRPAKRVLLALLIFILLCGGLYYTKSRVDDGSGSKVSEVAGQKSPQPAKKMTNPGPSPSGRSAEFVEANNIAVEYVRNHEHWRAVYLLTSLVEQYPERIEPLINLGVALAEVGLWEPAHEYLARARTLDPRHPLLRENIAILRRAGLFDEFTSSSLEEGKRHD